MLWAAKKQCAEMVRGRRSLASQKGHPVHSDIRGDTQKGVIGKRRLGV